MKLWLVIVNPTDAELRIQEKICTLHVNAKIQ